MRSRESAVAGCEGRAGHDEAPGRAVVRIWTAHRNPHNLRLHVMTSAIAWLALTTCMSQVALPFALPPRAGNLGALAALIACAAWLFVDALSALAILTMTASWAAMCPIWGPGHGAWLGVLLPASVFLLVQVIAGYSHVYHHEHADYQRSTRPLAATIDHAHSLVLGVFHHTLAALLDAGFRPGLKTRIEVAERAANQLRHGVPWRNWARTASSSPWAVSVPRTIDEMACAVREATRAGRRVRVVGSGFSWSGIAATDDLLLFCERLAGIEIDDSDPRRPAVWAEAGVTNRQLNLALSRCGLTMPWNVVLENVRVAGIVSCGTHGSGRETATLGDLVEALEVIDGDGRTRVLSEATIGREAMNAARCGLGLFGVIARVRLRVVSNYRVRQVDAPRPLSEVLDRIAELVAEHDAVELYWFAFNSELWLRTVDRTDEPRTFSGHGFGFVAMNFVQNLGFMAVTRSAQRVRRSLTRPALRLGFRFMEWRTRVLDLAESQHYRRWIEMVRCGCVEVGFKMDARGDNVRRAFESAERLVARYAARGLYPMNLTLNLRFTGSSEALLSAAYGEGITCFIEALCVGRPEGWDELSAELLCDWLRIDGALPHWAKEFEGVPGLVPLLRERLGGRRERFLRALAEHGAGGRRHFGNRLIDEVLFEQSEASAPAESPRTFAEA